VTTLNAGAGLESQIVFLVGLRLLFEEEQSLRLSDEEREELDPGQYPQALHGGHSGRAEAGADVFG